MEKTNGKLGERNARTTKKKNTFKMNPRCLNKKINYLLTAHHMDDQIENFFIRLFRGSGLTGLSSMSESVEYSKKLKIIRPLLGFKKKI